MIHSTLPILPLSQVKTILISQERWVTKELRDKFLHVTHILIEIAVVMVVVTAAAVVTIVVTLIILTNRNYNRKQNNNYKLPVKSRPRCP